MSAVPTNPSASAPPRNLSFDTVLVANRGEIAVRVMRTARAMGYRTVAVYSDADAGGAHVVAADDAIRLGPAPARESYLDIEAVIAAARASGAGAIHPGYGFLAENAAFATACADAGIVFIGPPASAITLMGDKAAAKRRMAGAGVPLLDGYQGDDQSDAVLLAEAERLGAPLMVKAAAGGGGKGMRLVTDPAAVPDALAAARREALGAFGDDTLILERAIQRPRHVEIQVLADTHGHVIALGERDCSVQRRHQKVVEEAPSPALNHATRDAMQAAAVAAAADIGYVGAGTVEFLLDGEPSGSDEVGTFAFLEMNTRLQVEHPVTEMITGLDLVEWQLRIARGEPLTVQQDDVSLTGHAMEARLYAEDAAAGYLPQTGTVVAWSLPEGDGVRVDAGVDAGQAVTAHYDPMLAKVIAHGADRDEARRRLADALDRLVCLGVRTNRTFLSGVLRHPTFADGGATTAFLEEHEVAPPPPTPADVVAVAGWQHLHRREAAGAAAPGLAGWTNAVWLTHERHVRVGEDTWTILLRDVGDAVEVSTDGATERSTDGATMEVRHAPAGVVVDGRFIPLTAVAVGDDRVLARLRHVDVDLTDVTNAPAADGTSAGAGVLTAPMHGAVTAVQSQVGATVSEGDPLLIMEAMKMEHVITADIDGTVSELAAVGDQVADGDVVARVVPPEED